MVRGRAGRTLSTGKIPTPKQGHVGIHRLLQAQTLVCMTGRRSSVGSVRREEREREEAGEGSIPFQGQSVVGWAVQMLRWSRGTRYSLAVQARGEGGGRAGQGRSQAPPSLPRQDLSQCGGEPCLPPMSLGDCTISYDAGHQLQNVSGVVKRSTL